MPPTDKPMLTKGHIAEMRRLDLYSMCDMPAAINTIEAAMELLEAFVLRGPCDQHRDPRWNEAAHLLAAYHGTSEQEGGGAGVRGVET